MDKSLIAFLNPERKANLRLAVTPAYKDENGAPMVWEFCDLPSAESMALAKRYANNTSLLLVSQIAHACVYPPLKDEEFLKALSKRAGKTILDPVDALYALLYGSELSDLTAAYLAYFQGDTFAKMIEEAKN